MAGPALTSQNNEIVPLRTVRKTCAPLPEPKRDEATAQPRRNKTPTRGTERGFADPCCDWQGECRWEITGSLFSCKPPDWPGRIWAQSVAADACALRQPELASALKLSQPAGLRSAIFVITQVSAYPDGMEPQSAVNAIEGSPRDPLLALTAIGELRRWLAMQEQHFVGLAREEGFSWTGIAEGLGRSKQSVWERYRSADPGDTMNG
jgi:hypothetical protein